MNDSGRPNSPNRRRFLRDTSLTGMAALSAFPEHSYGGGGVNDVLRIDLGLRPTADAIGPVVVESNSEISVSFSAANLLREGTALTRFSNCKAWRLHQSSESGSATGNIDLDQLPTCQVFEVANSSWAAEQQPQHPGLPLRHFIITFAGSNDQSIGKAKHFECLAESAEIGLVSLSEFESLIA